MEAEIEREILAKGGKLRKKGVEMCCGRRVKSLKE